MLAHEEAEDVKIIRLNSRSGSNPDRPTWVGTTQVDMDDEKKMTTFWKKLRKDPSFIHSYISDLSAKNKIKLKKVKWIKSNGKLVKVSDIYTASDKVYAVFDTETNGWKLWVTGVKTAHEMIRIGTNKKGESFSPFLLAVTPEKKFAVLNSL